MPFLTFVRRLLDRRALRFVLIPLVTHQARSKTKSLKRIIYDDGVWIYETSSGYFAFRDAITGLDMSQIEELTRLHFLWGYQPRNGDIVMDVGAGVGEEALTFSRKVGQHGKVICVEGHPRTYNCLEKLIEYNRLTNVTAIHQIVTEPSCNVVTIEDSNNYLSNRILSSVGIRVAATTIDSIYRKLGLGRVNFLKMNIEGAERLAIKGMTEAIKCTEVLCISCHDFLALETGNDFFRTKRVVKEFLQHNGLRVVERYEEGLPYLADQLWAYNERLREGPAS
jgi:FkbM family methyltransferase